VENTPALFATLGAIAEALMTMVVVTLGLAAFGVLGYLTIRAFRAVVRLFRPE
jgi:hypothetical protein